MQIILFIHFYSEEQIVTLQGLYLSNFLLLRIQLRPNLPEYEILFMLVKLWIVCNLHGFSTHVPNFACIQTYRENLPTDPIHTHPHKHEHIGMCNSFSQVIYFVLHD